MMRKKDAFTLVELLVVIGIIAVLISILLPSLNTARRQAAKIKCAAQMRDLGMAMSMYTQENKGFLPPVRLNTPYNIAEILYDKGGAEVVGQKVNENVKWWHFLGKYLTKSRTMAQTPQDMELVMKGVFWCPSFPGYSDTTGTSVNMVGGINRNFTGFGMNKWPTLRADTTLASLDSDGFPPATQVFWDCLKVTSPGVWYKITQFSNPSERALLGDARQFYLESKLVAVGAQIPGQRLNFSNNDYSNGVTGQSMFDFYRHGVYPPAAVADPVNGYYAVTGGKIGYNVLYVDDHVDSPNDRETGYRVCRMRFPG